MTIGKRTFQSAGKISQHLIPGGYSRIDAVKGAAGFASANNGVIMGSCLGGQPATLLQFNNLADAVRTLKGGELMEAMRVAFNPGNDYVPQRLFAMRVNTAVQSLFYLIDGSSNNMVKLLSKDYGLQQNQLKAKMETSTDTFGKKITIVFKQDTETFDNIRRTSFTIAYSGGACTMTIVNNSTTHTLVTSVGGINITDLAAYPTIGDLVAYINTQTSFTAAATAGQEDASSLLLDSVTTVSIATTYTAESTMQGIIDTINSYSNYCTAVDMSATHSRVIPANKAYAYFTGGAEGSYTASEWSAALTKLEAEDIQFVSTPSSSSSVHSVIKTHCESMSNVSRRKERQFLVGGAWGDSVATATAASIVLNSKYGLYAYNGFTQYDVNGVVQNYPASYYACTMLGQMCTAALNETCTFKTLNVISLENKLKESDVETLILNGVCAANYNSQGLPHTVRMLNSYQTDDLLWNEFSSAKEMLFVSRDLRQYLEGIFVGHPGNNLTGGVLRGIVLGRLQTYVTLGCFTTGVEGAYWNVSISISGDTVTIDYDAYITLPVNFMFVTQHFHQIVATI